jgi:hypothetical protein
MSFKVIIVSIWNKLRLYLSFLLLVFYLIIGFLFLFSDIWAGILPKGREWIGAGLVAFAALRFYVAYRRYKSKYLKIQILKEERKKRKEQQYAKAEKVS